MTLKQEEMEALLRAAKDTQAAAQSADTRKIVRFDVRMVNRLTEGQRGLVSALQASFARRLGDSLGAHLRVAFDLKFISVDQQVYREFASTLPELTYFASVHAMPIDARLAIQCDFALVYPIIDALLGGSGMDSIDLRELTEIEEQMFETVVGLIINDLRSTWTPILPLDFSFEQRQRGVQVQNTIPPEDKVLCISFEGRLGETTGKLAVVIPAVIANALLRRLSAQGSSSARMPSRASRRRVCEHLLESRFTTDLSLPSSLLAMRALIELEPGKVLLLPKDTREPVHLNVAGKAMFLAHPIRQGARRCARVEKQLSLIPFLAKK